MKKVGIACYIDNDRNIVDEFGWLYKSWLYSGSWFTSDIIAFHNPIVPLNRLPQDLGIKYVPLIPFADKYPEWSDYRFINSIGYMGEPEAAILTEYEFILRTDCDCFLTPYFPSLQPRLVTFGAGLYASVPSVAIRLAQIAEKWKVDSVFNNVGSTLMGPPDKVMIYSNIQLEFCKKLRYEEFTPEEWDRGVESWPGWYKGVLSMYAGQLAAQSYFGAAMNIGGLDCHCMCYDQISPSDYHIHAWHSLNHFSKQKWRDGFYKNHDMSKLDLGQIADYCLWIAGPGRGE